MYLLSMTYKPEHKNIALEVERGQLQVFVVINHFNEICAIFADWLSACKYLEIEENENGEVQSWALKVKE